MKAEERMPGAEGAGMGSLILGARDAAPVTGLTHNFYRYPARFSPAFARGAIQAFTEPGDWILDPFAGGGTTLVEAMALGRNAIGVDISALATFICEAKTLILEDRELKAFRLWASRLPSIVNMHAPGHRFDEYADLGYYRNLEGNKYWRLRKAIEQAIASIIRLRSDKVQTLARCVVLRTAQWALDSRKVLPTVGRFRNELFEQTKAMLFAAAEFRASIARNPWGRRPKAICINRPASGLEDEATIARVAPPKLVVTSPPYPGVHVLYHRWQVDGRREAPAPFWIAKRLDGAGSSYYTMGDRKYPELKTYFDSLKASFRSVASVCGPETIIVQLVAFSEPDWQLKRYLHVMERCGLRELLPWEVEHVGRDGRLWRDVPNRRWHADQKGPTGGSREVVLIHRKSR